MGPKTFGLKREQFNNWGVEIEQFSVKGWSDGPGSQLFESG